MIGSLATIAVALIAAVASNAGRKSSKRAAKELQPNGGSSFRDVVDRRLTSHDERLDRMEQAGLRRDQRLEDIADVVQKIHRRQTGEDS